MPTPEPASPADAPLPDVPTPPGGGQDPIPAPAPDVVEKVSQLEINGSVPYRQFNQLFQSFILPMSSKGAQPLVEVTIKGDFSSVNGLPKNDPMYKAMVEAARQMGIQINEVE